MLRAQLMSSETRGGKVAAAKEGVTITSDDPDLGEVLVRAVPRRGRRRRDRRGGRTAGRGEVRSSRGRRRWRVEVVLGVDLVRVVRRRDRRPWCARSSGVTGGLVRGRIVVDRYKWIRTSFLSAVLDSGSHWLARPIVENQLADGVNLFAVDP